MSRNEKEKVKQMHENDNGKIRMLETRQRA